MEASQEPFDRDLSINKHQKHAKVEEIKLPASITNTSFNTTNERYLITTVSLEDIDAICMTHSTANSPKQTAASTPRIPVP